MKCQTCGAENAEGSAFCLSCGTDFPAAGAAPSAKAAAPAATGKCPKCGAKNPPDAAFCGLCGEKFAAPPTSMVASGSASDPNAAIYHGGQASVGLSASDTDLERKIYQGGATPAEYAKLADLKIAQNRREEAARLLNEAILRDPKNKSLIEQYTARFTVNELKNWGLTKPPIDIVADLPAILWYPLENGEWLGLLFGAIFVFLLRLFAMPPTGVVLLVLAFGYTTTLFGKHLKWAALGRYGHPQVLAVEFGHSWNAFASVIACFLPFLLLPILAIFAAIAVPNALPSRTPSPNPSIPITRPEEGFHAPDDSGAPVPTGTKTPKKPLTREDIRREQEKLRAMVTQKLEELKRRQEAGDALDSDEFGATPKRPSAAAILAMGVMGLAILAGVLVLYLLGLYLLPMAFLAATLFNAAGTAFRYGFLIRSIFRMFKDYTIAFFVLAAVSIAQMIVLMLIPYGGFVVADFLALYVYVVYAQILGRLYYNHQKDLAWF